MSDLLIRAATTQDVGAITRIYNHYVRTSTATFDAEEKTAENRAAWLAGHGPGYPVLVALADGDVIAWGSLSEWGTRCAYRHSVEISVYVAPDAVNNGVGPRVCGRLLAEARGARHHAVVTQIVSENVPSLKMAERLGFSEVGTLHEIGRKFDRWLDVVLMELVLTDEPPEDS